MTISITRQGDKVFHTELTPQGIEVSEDISASRYEQLLVYAEYSLKLDAACADVE